MTSAENPGGEPANSGQSVTMFTQDQVNHFVAQGKRGALDGFFKEIGFDKTPTPEELKNINAAAAEHQKVLNGQKTDVERLTTENGTLKAAADKVPALEADLLRAKLAGDSGLKSRYWRYVEGDDEESIKASIKEVLGDIRGGGDGSGDDDGDDNDDDGDDGAKNQNQNGRSGTGKLDPNPQQGAGRGGGKPKPTLSSGADAYKAKHTKE